MHKPVVIALEHLMVPCILESCLPSLFVDEVNIITPELILHNFIVCLDTRETMVISGGITTTPPYTKRKGVAPMARLEDVLFPHSAHGSSSIHLAPCFFKQL
jgi:hypothetical protein